MKPKEEFFSQLAAEFPEHPLKERYLSELRDHVEDLEEDLQLNSHQLTPELMSKKLGSPKEIKNNFFDVMLPLRHLIFGMESLLWGSLLVPPLVYMGIILMYLSVDVSPANEKPLIFLGLLSMLGLNLLSIYIYKVLQGRGKVLESKLGISKTAWGLSLLVPPFISLPFIGIAMFREFGISSIAGICLLVAVLGAFSLAVVLKKNSFLDKPLARLNTLATPSFLFFFSLLFVMENLGFPLSGVLGTANTFLAWSAEILLLPFTPLSSHPEKLLTFIPTLGVLLSLSALCIVFSMFYFRQWLWAQASLLLIILGCLFSNPFLAHSWLFHSQSLISAYIEQEEFGHFYRLARFWNQTRRGISYNVEFMNGAFHVGQNLGKTYSFNPKNILQGPDYKVKLDNSAPYDDTALAKEPLPESFKCLEVGLDPTYEKTDTSFCAHFTLEGEYFEFYVEPRSGYSITSVIHDIAISDDKQSAVLVVSSSETPQEVYFVDLRPQDLGTPIGG